MRRIPDKNKKFTVDNSSMSRGNVFNTFNIMFDADIGRIKLNPYVFNYYDEDDDAGMKTPFAMVVADQAGGGQLDTYVLTTTGASAGFVYSTLSGLSQISVADSPSKATDSTSDMCLFLGANSEPWIHVSDEDGLHYVDPSLSTSAWTIQTNAGFKNKFILVPFLDTNRLYMFTTTSVTSWDGTSSTPTTSGAYTQVGGLSGISCARASSKRIWYAMSGITVSQSKSKIYEWDGVNVNPLNIHVIDTDYIQAITILNDLPVAIDGRGRLWFYDGYSFKLRDGANLPVREDNFDSLVCRVHRNGMITDKGKIYVLVGVDNRTKGAGERALAGVWCYDPNVGFYHYASPENASMILEVLALSKHTSDNTFIMGYLGSVTSTTGSKYRLARTDTGTGITSGDSLRTGFITTQFMESDNLTNVFDTIAIKYRKMIYDSAEIEVKFRPEKKIEGYGTVTWTSASTFTVATTTIDGTGTYFNSVIEIGDEVMIQNGANAGLIAHITNISSLSGTSTITIDRSATLTSGTAYAMFSNFKLVDTISPSHPFNYKNIRIDNNASTMIQVKVVMRWKGYYDELQEILLPDNAKEKTQ